MSFRHATPACLLVLALTLAAAGRAFALEPETLEAVSRATVFLKVERVFTAERFTTVGTGF